MRRLTCTEDGSNKFWEGAVEGSSLTVRWGKVGTSGQSKTKPFASAEAAERELAKLVKEKLGKGYVEDGGAPAPAAAPVAAPGPVAKPAAAPVAASSAPPLGKYTRALIAMLESKPLRKAPDAGFAAWAAVETRPDLRALFEAMAARAYKYPQVDEFLLTEGVGRVPSSNDPGSVDRTDVIWIGGSAGGDGYVVKAPGTSDDPRVELLIHDEDWISQRSWRRLEDLLAEQVANERRQQLEDGTEPDEVSIELETYIAKPGGDAELPVSGGKLTLVKGMGRRQDGRDQRERWNGATAPTEFTKVFRWQWWHNYGAVGHQDTYWHGRYTFGSMVWAVEGTEKRAVRAAVFDRGGAQPVVTPVEPAVFRAVGLDENFDSTILFGFADDGTPAAGDAGARLLVAGCRTVGFKDGALVDGGGTAVCDVACATGAATPVCEGDGDIEGVGWVGELAAVIRRVKKANQLELYGKGGGAWTLVRTVACGKLNAILPFGGGRVAVLTKTSRGKVKSHFLGVRGADVRLLGSVDGVLYQAYQLADGKVVVSGDANDNTWSELRHLDEAIDAAFAGPPPELRLDEK